MYEEVVYYPYEGGGEIIDNSDYEADHLTQRERDILRLIRAEE